MSEPEGAKRMRSFFDGIDAEAVLGLARRTIALHEDEATVLAKKADAFQREVLVAALEHVAIDKADTNVGEIKFSDCLKKRILKKADLSSYDFDEPVLLNSKF